MSRFSPLDIASLTAAQRHVYDQIATGPRGAVTGPLCVWLRSPELASRAQSLGEYCRYNTSLSKRLSELAIMITAAHWRALYEWEAHKPHALSAGIKPEVLSAIFERDTPAFDRTDERATYMFAQELLATRRVSDQTWQLAHQNLGEASVVDLIGVLGYYGLISMTIVAFDIRPPSETPDPIGWNACA
jgi:4-carboxymuconolactone decarboxylase